LSEKAQSYDNHARWYPLWHFVAAPILTANVIVALVAVVRGPSMTTGWQLLVAIALVFAILASRNMNIMTQDRIIRGEERGRLKELLPADMQASIQEFTPDQLIGLRFASDEEVPGLAKQILDGSLTNRGAIKKAVKNWRADHMRV
jgi:hypothetical protein